MQAKTMASSLKLCSLAALTVAVVACGGGSGGDGVGQPAVKETADEFVTRVNKDMYDFSIEAAEAGWVQATFITKDTQAINARANERFLAYFSKAVKQAKAYDGQTLSPTTVRPTMKPREPSCRN
jgi:peptidyl-dipeptidase A